MQPSLGVHQLEGQPIHPVIEVLDDGVLFLPPLGLVEVLSNALESSKGHLKMEPVWVGGVGVL